MKKWLTMRFCLYWFLRFLIYVTGITLVGAAVGALTFPLVGVLFGLDHSIQSLARRGTIDIAFFAFIWAPAISLVVCVMQARSALRKTKEPGVWSREHS